MKQFLYLLTITLLLFTTACESTIENDKLAANTENSLKGDWMVTAYMDGNDTYGPFNINVKTTSDKNSVTINDKG